MAAARNSVFFIRSHFTEALSRSLFPIPLSFRRGIASAVRLIEVGRFEEPKALGKYPTGQLFLHKIFGYRGVILFPWMARVFDRDASGRKDPAKIEPSTTAESAHFHNIGTGRDVKGKTVPYYQVLIDARDCPFIRAQSEAVTFLGHQESSRSLYAIPGLDYISHEDVLPYMSTEKNAIMHELFDKFLMHDPEKGVYKARETLHAWQERNHPWLELSDVHREITDGIRVTVIPFYMGCKKVTGDDNRGQSVYWWRYCIRLENHGEEVVQLRERHWRIFSLSGTLETVRGRGVVGQEPVLSPNLPAFQYSSHVSLQAPSGHMWGTFRFEREDGGSIHVKIPPFSLESKDDDSNTYTVV
ncbi:polymerase delta-interacting protein 2 [Hypsibius exemplaris]|uniref:Polymerase delta-interacting protein 2 n=1 Tax=Hypsibius exemplaris TaxID=2072580 RepID=A0A1W0WZP1_HYPEX|nr:polymerase delta-interacting protein 2 [Hypsibius exemplaris]